MSRFLNQTLIYTTYDRQGVFRTTTVDPNPSYQYLKPVVLLINGTSASAAEIFPGYLMREPNITLIGDTTAGEGCNTFLFNLPSGKQAQITNRYFKTSEGVIVEWNGVAPDIRVEQTKADAQNGVDRQLEFAREYLTEIINER